MSIIDKDKIDLIGNDDVSKDLILTISDHLDWNDELFHLQALQSKINTYIEFVESGQIKIDFPDSLLSKKMRIEIVSQYDYPKIGLDFLEKVKPVLSSVGLEIAQNTIDNA